MQKIYDTCTLDGCDRAHKARGYCQTHYMQYKRGVPLVAAIKVRQRDKPDCCSADGCDQPVKSKGLCKMHYQRTLRHGHVKNRPRISDYTDCLIPSCDNKTYALGLCHAHYIKERKWKAFGITAHKYIEMLDAQGGLCLICDKPERATDGNSGKVRDMAIDHCHKTLKVRGLLCSNCNRGVGLMCDDPNILRKAADYLEKASS